MQPSRLFRGVLLAAGIAACSSPTDDSEPTSVDEAALGSACNSRTLRVSDLHADFRDIWAGRESADTGKQGEPDEKVVIDFSAAVDPSRLAAQFVPTTTDGSCGGSIATTVPGSVSATSTWGTTSSDSTRPKLPAPYNVLARESISGVVSAAGALAAGGDITLTSMSVNGTVAQPFGLIAGGKLILSNGSVQGNVTFGAASTFPQTVTISGTKTLQPFNLDSAFQNLEVLSGLLNEQAATGSVQSNYGTLTLSGTKSGLNVFQLSADVLRQASNVVVSVPAGAGALVNVSGANVAIQNKGLTLQGATAGGLLWNFPNASFLQISSIGMYGSLLAPAARLTFDSGSISGTLVVRNFASSGSGSLLSAPLNASLLLGSAPMAVALAPSQPLLRGCTYRFTVSASTPLTSGGNCLTADLNVPFRVASHASDAASRELAGAAPDPALKTLRRFEARPGINTPLDDVWARYEGAIGVPRSTLVPVGAPRPNTMRPGFLLTSYQQYHLGYPVAGFGYLVATEAGNFRSADGSAAKNLPSSLPTPIGQAQALQSALQFLQVTTPPWVSNPSKFHAPLATLALTPLNASPASASDFRLLWVIDFSGTGVLQTATVELDGATGSVLATTSARYTQAPPVAFLDANATYVTTPPTVPNTVVTLAGDGAQTINLARYQNSNGSFVTTLSNGRALAAGTLNTHYQGIFVTPPADPRPVIDPTPATPWTTTERTEQMMAHQHWGLERSNDFVRSLGFAGASPLGLPWTSIDGSGHQLVLVRWVDTGVTGSSNAAYAADLSNADTATIVTLVGVQGPPLGRLVIPHEFGHAFLASVRRAVNPLNDRIGNRYEAGTISEALADLFALAAMHSLGEPPGWTCVTPTSTCSRDVRNPFSTGNPAFYQDTNYANFVNILQCTDANDKCEIHKNSTLLSHWGYLLAFGSQGVPGTNPCGLSVSALDPSPDVSFKRLLNINYGAAGVLLASISPDQATFAGFRDSALRAAQNMVALGQAPDDTTRKLELAFYAVGLGPAFVTAPADTSLAPRVRPLDDSMSVKAWQTFSWPASADGLQADAWDFQIADDPLFSQTSLRHQEDFITSTEVRDGTTVFTFRLALPFESSTRLYWRVRPHTMGSWQACYPVHSFRGTTPPDAIENVTLETTQSDGLVDPGELRASYIGVPNGTQYRFGIGTTDNDCVGDSDVFQTTRVAAPAEVEQPTMITETFRRLEPNTSYWLEIQAIGPNDFAGNPSPGPCFKRQFTTGALKAPFSLELRHHVPDLFVNDDVVDIRRGAHLSWRVWGGTETSTVRFFERDENGVCSTTLAATVDVNTLCPPNDTCAFCNTCDGRLDTVVSTRPNPSGYCWTVTATAANGEESPASPTEQFEYVDRVSPILPGVSIVEAFAGDPEPLLGDSADEDVTFVWEPDPFTSHYMVRVSRWPHGGVPGLPPNDPDNCAITQPSNTGFTCLTPTVTFSEVVEGTTIRLPASVASGGRYCWTVWPLYANPLNPNEIGARQPLVSPNPMFCYTSGAITPRVVVDQVKPAGGYPQGKPLTGYILFPYVPTYQFAFGTNAEIEFGDWCLPVANYTVYPDAVDCRITFKLDKPKENFPYRVLARTWNSPWILDGTGSLPPRDPDYQLPDVIEDIEIASCGANDEACCDDTTCDASLTCKAGKCTPCGASGQSCCGTDCNAGFACDSTNKCIRCGLNSDPCCPGGVCSTNLQCGNNNKCSSCGTGTGSRCCTPNNTCSGFNQCKSGFCEACGKRDSECCNGNSCADDPAGALTCISNKCLLCGHSGQRCCPAGIVGSANGCFPSNNCNSSLMCVPCGALGQNSCFPPDDQCQDGSQVPLGSPCPGSMSCPPDFPLPCLGTCFDPSVEPGESRQWLRDWAMTHPGQPYFGCVNNTLVCSAPLVTLGTNCCPQGSTSVDPSGNCR